MLSYRGIKYVIIRSCAFQVFVFTIFLGFFAHAATLARSKYNFKASCQVFGVEYPWLFIMYAAYASKSALPLSVPGLLHCVLPHNTIAGA